MPRVSVILPCYNHEAFVEEAIRSVLGQRFGDLELVVVDDGSIDGSVARIRQVVDRRLRLHSFQSNQGAHNALNKGLELSDPRSDYLAILNSDDRHDPAWLEQGVALLDARPEVGFCAARLHLFGAVSAEKRQWYRTALDHYRQGGDAQRSLLHANFIVTTSNLLFRRSLLSQLGGFRPLRYAHDLDLLLRLSERTGFALIDRELVAYRVHESNTLGETVRDEGNLLFEVGWILADRLYERLEREADLEAFAHYLGDMVLSVWMLDSVAVALVLFGLYCRHARQGGIPQERAALAASLLEPDHPLRMRLLERDPDRRRKQLFALQSRVAELEQLGLGQSAERAASEQRLRASEHRIAELEARIWELVDSKYYRYGEALAQAGGWKGLAQLPGRLLRLSREARRRASRPPGGPPG